jgi:hypothetical protein
MFKEPAWRDFDMRKLLTLVTATALVSGLMASSPVAAHHSFALFDMTRTVSLEGTVKKFEWANPHSWITLQVAGAGNSMEEWMIELPSAGALAREGWNKNFVKSGEKLIMRVNPLKDGKKGGSLTSFTPGGPEPS